MTVPTTRPNTLLVEGAPLLYRNFSGRPTQFNPQGGKRDFSVVLEDPATVERLIQEGWNVKQRKSRPDEEPGVVQPYYLTIKLNFGNRPPRVVMVSSKGRTTLGVVTDPNGNIIEDTVSLLDWCDILHLDCLVNPYIYSQGDGGIAAYAKSVFVRIEEDYLEKKYADLPELNQRFQPLAIEAGNPDEDDILDVESWYEEDPKAIEQ